LTIISLFSAFNHQPSSNAEAEYDRLRANAREEQHKRQELSHKSQEAYQRGDGALAKELSNQAKEHASRADDWNEQASNYIFRENNASEHVPDNTIDLHGQYVEEAIKILDTRIRAAKSQGQTFLHVIVGKGNHSVNHIQKIKPAVEDFCDKLGIAHRVEPNEGRIYIDLTGNQNIPDQLPPLGQGHHGSGGYPGQYQQGYQQGYQQQATPGYQQPYGQQQQQQQQEESSTCCGCTVM
jgi:DNA-nicking Smr family endonuclease